MSNPALCVLTGASGGLGHAMANALAKEGFRLLLVGRNEIKLKQLNNQLGSLHGHLVADLTTEQGRHDLVSLAEQLGGADVLINNAGVNAFTAFCEQSTLDISKTLEVNLLVPMLITHAFLPQMRNKSHAKLVNVGSAFGSIGFPYHSSYCASKFGLRGFTEALKRELSDQALEVLYIAPRATDTDINGRTERAINSALGNQMDSPDKVAQLLIKQLKTGESRNVIGFPEKVFVKLNSLFPSLVDSAIAKKLLVMKRVLNELN